MTTSPSPTSFAAVLRRAHAIAVIAALLVASAALPSVWHEVSSALAAPGGNGKGNNGKGNGNGGPKDPDGQSAGGGAPASDGPPGNGKGNNGNGKGNGGPKDPDGHSAGSGSPASSEPPSNNGGPGGGEPPGGSASGGSGTPGTDDADQENAATSTSHQAPTATKRSATTPATVPATSEHGGHDFVARQVVVANIGGDIRTAIRRLGFVVLDERHLPSLDLIVTRLKVPDAMTAPAARRLLASRFPGMVVDFNTLYHPQGSVILPALDYPAKLIAWGNVTASCGRGLHLGMLDTAVDTTLPGLHSANIVQQSFLGADSAAASPEHGSAIAWLLLGQYAGRAGGLLPGAELAVAGVFGTGANGMPTADVVGLIRGLDWLSARRTSVINMSFAGERNAVVALALRRAIAGGVIVVAAAGNGGASAAPAFPAAEAGVIAVTAVDSDAQAYPEANQGSYIAFAAPGVRVWTPGPTPTGNYHSGTSFAAPFAAAAVAAQLADEARPDVAQIERTLARTARDLGPAGKDTIFGWGLLQATSPCSTLSAGRSE